MEKPSKTGLREGSFVGGGKEFGGIGGGKGISMSGGGREGARGYSWKDPNGRGALTSM